MFDDDIGDVVKAVPITRVLSFDSPQKLAYHTPKRPKRKVREQVSPTSYSAARQRVTSFHMPYTAQSPIVQEGHTLDQIIDTYIYETPQKAMPAAYHIDIDAGAKERANKVFRDFPTIWKRPKTFFRSFVTRKANISPQQLDHILHDRAHSIQLKRADM